MVKYCIVVTDLERSNVQLLTSAEIWTGGIKPTFLHLFHYHVYTKDT